MKNSVSDKSFYLRSDEEDDEGHPLNKNQEDDGNDTDSSCSSLGNHPRGNAGSVGSPKAAWPQSYRQSIDIYSSVQSPNIGFLGSPSLSRLGSSFLSSSLTRRCTPEILSKPLLPTVGVGDEQHQQQRQTSHSLLPPFPSGKSFTRKDKPSKVLHELPSTGKCSLGQTVLNAMNVLCGVGILSTPYAVKEGGWIGLFVLAFLALLSYYTGLLLLSCLDNALGLETYPDIGQAAFGTPGRVAVSMILYAELYVCCVEYIILESDNLSSLFPNAHLNVGEFELNSHHLFALLATLVVLPTVWLRDLRVLSYLSAGGVISSILVALCLFWVGLIDQVSIQSKRDILNLSSLPVAIGLFGYCYSGHAVLPNIYISMEKRSQYPLMCCASFGLVTVLYASVAVMGYMMFGESTASQFTLNMPQEFTASKIAVWATVVNPFTKYALTMIPVSMSLEELIRPGKSYIYCILVRTALVISTLIVSQAIPFFGLVMALVGSFLTMLISLILPCACYLSILKGRVTRLQGSLCVLIIAVGVGSSAAGTYSALVKIIKSLS